MDKDIATIKRRRFLDHGIYRTPQSVRPLQRYIRRLSHLSERQIMFQIADRRTTTGQTSRVENPRTGGRGARFPVPIRFPFPPASRLFCDRAPEIWRRFVGSNIRRVIMFVDRSEL